jgi:GrpB-like predicted nucleotidyltransferase (UPF0157 family)
MAQKGEIGLQRGTAKLVAHDPRGAESFIEEKELLLNLLGEKILHVS